jgi:hypothetical protein
MNQRILELAIEELERQKAAINLELEAIRAELGEAAGAGSAKTVVTGSGGRRGRSATERKAQSERMKKIWAVKRTLKAAGKKSAAPNNKTRKASSKAISEAMRAYWAKKKAGKAAKAK